MLHELRVENLLLMERAELRLGPGLNVITGETGAGKTLLAHALDLLLGGRARRGVVRPDAGEAWVEGVFDLPPELADDERLPDGAQELVLARRVWADGRTRAYVGGRAATQADLQELGGRLLAFHGQHEHRRLTLQAAQLDLLDAFAGAPVARLRDRVAGAHERARGLEARALELEELAGSRDRELDLLAFELAEIEAADPQAGERDGLEAERDRLRHQGELAAAAAFGADALTPEEGGGAAEAVASAHTRLAAASALDPGLEPLAARLEALQYEAADLAAELRAYLGELTGEGGGGAARLQELEERLALLTRLERKHGGTVQEVLAHAARCRARAEELSGSEHDLEAVRGELAAAVAERDAVAERLTAARVKAAPALAAQVRARLGELAMSAARFEIAVRPRGEGCGPRGADAIEMELAAGGEGAPAPLREVASGGELSRVMLALLSVAHGGRGRGSAPAAGGTLVFDEIDAGIGGHTARAVGEHLRALAAGRQVLCITHLPQVAALGERHFSIVKDTAASPPRTTVTALEGDGLIEELVRMMGAADSDSAAAAHARQLLGASA